MTDGQSSGPEEWDFTVAKSVRDSKESPSLPHRKQVGLCLSAIFC